MSPERHALWFANDADDAYEAPTFERNRSHDYVAREVAAVQHHVGGIEIANFAKHEFKGAGDTALETICPFKNALDQRSITFGKWQFELIQTATCQT